MISELNAGSGYSVSLEATQNALKTLCLTVFLLIVLRLEHVVASVWSACCLEQCDQVLEHADQWFGFVCRGCGLELPGVMNLPI
jgi:hypothetical protein